MPVDQLTETFDRQVQTLVDLDHAAAAGLTATAFRDLLEPLRPIAAAVTSGAPVAYVLVVRSSVVPVAHTMSRVVAKGRAGRVDMAGAKPLEAFRPVEGVDVPDAPAYLLVGVETGADLLDVRPDDALPRIVARGRSPLTVEEGVALLAQHPDALTRWNPYSLLGSRAGDRRVPALWVSYGAPRLGWCWAGAPHTWLGSASCATRVGA